MYPIEIEHWWICVVVIILTIVTLLSKMTLFCNFSVLYCSRKVAVKSFNQPWFKDLERIFSRTFSLTCFLWDRYGRCWLFNFFTREMMMLWCRDGRVCAVFCVEKCVFQVYAVLDVRWSLLLGFLLHTTGLLVELRGGEVITIVLLSTRPSMAGASENSRFPKFPGITA